MKRKLLIMLVIFTLLFSNFSFAADYKYNKNNSDKDLKDVAKIADSEDTYIGTQYTAQSNPIKDYEIDTIYRIGTNGTSSPIDLHLSVLETNLKNGNLEIENGDGFKILMREENPTDADAATYKVWLEINQDKLKDSYIIYRKAIKYNNKDYDVKINVKSYKASEENIKFRFLIGAVKVKILNKENLDYGLDKIDFRPEIVASGMKNLETEKAELSVEYTIGNYNSGFAVDEPISGLFTLGEVDFGQGIAMDNWKINEENANVFIKQKLADMNFMKYQTNDSSTYFYTINKENMNSNVEDIYLLMENVTNIPMTLTFDGHNAGSYFVFNSNLIKKQDQEQVTVTFDSQGGGSTPDKQYIEKGKVATEPTSKPTKDGYTFTGWYTEKDCKNKYDFSTKVEEDKTLYAGWDANQYNITYVLNGGTNDSSNPSTYRTGDTVTFKAPTKENSTFLGWYAKEDFSGNPIGSISNRTGNITLYAKWKTNEAENAKYKTEYYTEENGKYILRDTSEGEGKVGTSVTAVRKTFDGYEENTTYNERKATGTVTANGDLVLKLYYDKKQYKVTFDAQGGEEAKKGDLDDQTVKYNDKATEPTNPTKNGYEFEYWYYEKNGKEIQYDFKDPVTGDVKLIAKWKTKSSGTSTSGKTDSSTSTNSSKNTTTSGKVDSTTAKSEKLPDTGSVGMILIISVIVVGTVFFGIRYFKLKNDMK